jgi:hypothetical protein
MGGLLLWLAEQLGGVALKALLARLFGGGKQPDAAARVTRDEDTIAVQQQAIASQQAREQADDTVSKLKQPAGAESSVDAPADSAAGRMRDGGWTDRG